MYERYSIGQVYIYPAHISPIATASETYSINKVVKEE